MEAGHALAILVGLLTAKGNVDEAITTRRDLLAVQRRLKATESVEFSGDLADFATLLLRRGTLEAATEAAPLLRECLAIREKVMPGDWRLSNAKSLLGAAILALAELDGSLTPDARIERFHEAEHLLIEAYNGMQDDPSMPPPSAIGADRKREALERITKLYEIWSEVEPDAGHDAEAARWRSELERPEPAASERAPPGAPP
jgi:hypothetical protein